MTFNLEEFIRERNKKVIDAQKSNSLQSVALEFVAQSDRYNYGYFWEWLGLPIIQMPEDVLITQELIFRERPNVVIEAGIAWGGSLALYASIQTLLGFGQTIGIDITIPEHNAKRILSTPVSNRITLIEGSSTDTDIYNKVKNMINPTDKKLVVLDSNHTHEHVLNELRLWSKLLNPGDWLIVSDTIVEHIPKQLHRIRPWGPGNNPGSALRKFLEENQDFTDDNSYSNRTFASFSPRGYVQRK
jgi:cephalosporin hydroxylase